MNGITRIAEYFLSFMLSMSELINIAERDLLTVTCPMSRGKTREALERKPWGIGKVSFTTFIILPTLSAVFKTFLHDDTIHKVLSCGFAVCMSPLGQGNGHIQGDVSTHFPD